MENPFESPAELDIGKTNEIEFPLRERVELSSQDLTDAWTAYRGRAPIVIRVISFLTGSLCVGLMLLLLVFDGRSLVKEGKLLQTLPTLGLLGSAGSILLLWGLTGARWTLRVMNHKFSQQFPVPVWVNYEITGDSVLVESAHGASRIATKAIRAWREFNHVLIAVHDRRSYIVFPRRQLSAEASELLDSWRNTG